MNGDLKQTFVDVLNELLNSGDSKVREHVSTQVHILIADGWRVPITTSRNGDVVEVYDIEWSERSC